MVISDEVSFVVDKKPEPLLAISVPLLVLEPLQLYVLTYVLLDLGMPATSILLVVV